MASIHVRNGQRSGNFVAEEQSLFVDHSDEEKGGHKRRRRGFARSGIRRWRNRICLLVSAVVLILFGSLLISNTESDTSPSSILDPSLHVVLYGSENHTSTINLCRAILTTSALDYPPVTFMNGTIQRSNNGGGMDNYVGGYYGEDEDEAEVWHRYKIDGVLQMLWNRFSEEQENDIVVVTEGYETFFQLPSSILLERYHRLNADAKRRDGVEQTVIFAASKTCSSQATTEPWCYLQTQTNTFSKGMYLGVNVEKPHYLDSGFIMGPVKDLRVLLSHAQNYQMQLPDHGGRFRMRRPRHRMEDQAVLNIIFAEQQLYRSMMRERHLTWYNRATKHIAGIFPMQSSNNPAMPERVGLLPSRMYDFHMGIDYTASLVHVNDLDAPVPDSRFIKYSEPPSKAAFNSAGCTPRFQKLPRDIARSAPPFRYLRINKDDTEAPPVFSGWADVDLYTNICTGNIPGAILYRSRLSTSKLATTNVESPSQIKDWHSLWLHGHARQLREAQMWRAQHASAHVIGGSTILGATSTEEELDPAVDVLRETINVGDVMWTDRQGLVAWDDVCGKIANELFGRASAAG